LTEINFLQSFLIQTGSL